MRKLTLVFALLLCLVLVLAFASCGKKTTTSTTAAPATEPSATTGTQQTEPDATTGAQPTEPEATTAPEPEVTTAPEPSHVHVPEAEYWIDQEPTCSTPGQKSLYCEECGEQIPDSIVEIPIDPDAHAIDQWIVTSQPTLLDKTPGSKHGFCSICQKDIEKVINFELDVYDSKALDGEYKSGSALAVRKKIGDIRDGKSFAPTPDDPDGNDLWFEYSFLYNDSLYYRDNPSNLAEIRMFAFRDNSTSSYRGFYYLYLRDNNDGFKTSTDCPWRGHIDYSTYDTTFKPEENCADDLSSLGNTLNGRLIGRYKAGWDPKRTESPYLWDSEWQTMNGWHRLGFRYHQEAKIENDTVVYTGYTELYIDGVLCWRIQSNFKPDHKDSLVKNQVLPWTAAIDPEDPTKLVYTHNDDLSVEMRIDNLVSSSQNVYIVIDDPQWTCGDGFATPVSRIDHPVASTVTLAEGVEDCDAMYFTSLHDHVFDGEYAVTKEATLLESGTRCKTCSVCGNYGAEEAYTFEPEVLTLSDTSNKDYYFEESNVIDSILAGGKHFYNEDSDLFIEFSILWNETVANNLLGDMTTGFCSEDPSKSVIRTSWMAVSDNAPRCDGKYAGGFELCDLGTVEYPTGVSMAGGSSAFDQFPNLGGADQANPEYGWHRVAIQLHQELTNEDALKADTTAGATKALYKLTGTLYLDGVKLYTISYSGDGKSNGGYWGTKMEKGLFSATSDGQGGIEYKDPDADVARYAFLSLNVKAKAAENPGYFVYGDVSFTCGKAPVQNVEKVATPTAATLTVAEGVTIPATMYFQAKSAE